MEVKNVEDKQLTLDDHNQWRDCLMKDVEEITAYKFKNSDLLYQAFTHSSFQEDSASYERLEYIGDSVLNMLISKRHYFDYPDLAPGKLTTLRAANVDTEKLARVAIKYNLHNYLRHKKPLLKAQVIKYLLQPLITPEKLEVHPMTKLHELCQKNKLKLEFVGHQWEKTGEIEVFVDRKLVGKGKSSGKKTIAQNRAAHNAYNQVVRNLAEKVTIDDDQAASEDALMMQDTTSDGESFDEAPGCLMLRLLGHGPLSLSMCIK
ncbi:hypothetical protein CQW23_17115 [Capsicum baccatum]|uniref:RNase III domain-containing protein n=1 Tax=Capsicum baccatum TaxID=33114 RepID=A0A2G2WDA4_CAPBA|nr:hypothetical protein CQW23_17115 [Capsicum baccatum]